MRVASPHSAHQICTVQGTARWKVTILADLYMTRVTWALVLLHCPRSIPQPGRLIPPLVWIRRISSPDTDSRSPRYERNLLQMLSKSRLVLSFLATYRTRV